MGQIKGYSHDIFTKEKESWKQLFAKAEEGKKQPAKRKHHGQRKTLTLSAVFVIAEREDEVDVDVGEWEPGMLIRSPCDSVSASEGKAHKAGFN